MAAKQVTVVVKLAPDQNGRYPTGCMLAYPSTPLTDNSNGQVWGQQIQVKAFDAGGGAAMSLVCTDDPAISPPGQGWFIFYVADGVRSTPTAYATPSAMANQVINLNSLPPLSGGPSNPYFNPELLLQPAIATPEEYGAKGDGKISLTGSISSGGVLTDTLNLFTSADVGKAIRVDGCGSGSNSMSGLITAVRSATSVQVSFTPNTAGTVPSYGYGTDDTAAFQAMTDALTAVGGGIGQCSDKSYVFAGPPRHDRGGNAVIAFQNIPETGTSGGNVIIRGVTSQQLSSHAATVLFSTHTGLAYSGSYGPPSLIGGPTPENNANAFSLIYPSIENVAILLAPNSTIAGIDLGRCVAGSTSGVDIEAWEGGLTGLNYLQPTNTWAFGIRYPGSGNYGIAKCYSTSVFGMYCGRVTATEHDEVLNFTAKWCYIAEGYWDTAQVFHMATGQKMQLEWCTYFLAGYTPATGLAAVASNAAGDGAHINYQGLDLEHGPGGHWFTTTEDIHDPTSQIYGQIVTDYQNANVGLTVNGGQMLDIRSVGQITSSVGQSWVIDCTTVPTHSGTVSVVQNSAAWNGGQLQYASSGASGSWVVDVPFGTYIISVFYVANTNGAPTAIEVNGVIAGGGYNAYAASQSAQTAFFAGVGIQGGRTVISAVNTGTGTGGGFSPNLCKIVLSRTA